MAVPLQQCTKQDQRSVVKFLFSEGVKRIEIHRRMRIQYGDRCMSRTQVYEGTEKFKNGVTKVWRILLARLQHSRHSRKTTLQPSRTWYGKTGASQSKRWHHYWTLVLDQPITSFMTSWSSEKGVQDGYPSDWHLKWNRDVSMLAKSFCVGMRLMVKNFCSVSSLGLRVGCTSTSQNESDKAWSGATPRPLSRRRCRCNDLQAKSCWLSSGITTGRS